jgi:hypothetical protein
MVDESYSVKIADFGFATLLSGITGNNILRTAAGTQGYQCPEYCKIPVILWSGGRCIFMRCFIIRISTRLSTI